MEQAGLFLLEGLIAYRLSIKELVNLFDALENISGASLLGSQGLFAVKLATFDSRALRQAGGTTTVLPPLAFCGSPFALCAVTLKLSKAGSLGAHAGLPMRL